MGRKDFQENWRFLDTAVSNTHSTLSESLLTAWDSRCNTLVLVMKCTLFAWFTGTTINLSVHTVYYSVCQMLYTVFRKKHPLTFSIITLASIFIIFVSVEREMNTLLTEQSWWRHNCVTLHVTKVYFIHGVKDEHWTTLLKNAHFCLDYNSGVSWSIFILFELWKREWILYK